MEWFDKAIAIFPYMIEAHFNKAVAYQELMDLANCIRAFHKVVEIGDRDDGSATAARNTSARIAPRPVARGVEGRRSAGFSRRVWSEPRGG